MPELSGLSTRSNKIILAVGDIHGCDAAADKLIQILESLDQPVPVVFLGDYVDRGPSSARTLELLTAAARSHPEFIFLLGNHEQMLLDGLEDKPVDPVHQEPNPASVEYEEMGGIPNAHCEFLRSLRPFHESTSFVFVHGGISRNPDLPIEKQSVLDLIWSYDVSPLWRGKTLVRGHARVDTPTHRDNHIDLDTGCGQGGWLSAGVLDDQSGRLLGYVQISPDGTQTRECWLDSAAESEFQDPRVQEWEREMRAKLLAELKPLRVSFGSLTPLEDSEQQSHLLTLVHSCVSGKAALSLLLNSSGLKVHLKRWPGKRLTIQATNDSIPSRATHDPEIIALVIDQEIMVISGNDETRELPEEDRDFLAYFRKTIGEEFPLSLIDPLVYQGGLIWGTPDAAERTRRLLPIIPMRFPDHVGDFTLTGFWGHGLNSWAFYYIQKIGRSTVFLRLFFGGVYGDPERDAHGVLHGLEQYLNFCHRYEGRINRFVYLNNMGDLDKRVGLKEGETLNPERETRRFSMKKDEE